jgi:hypothetical protein
LTETQKAEDPPAAANELKNLIANHRRQKAASAPKYLDALRQLQIRKGKGLDFEKSFRIITAAAKEHRFLSYKKLADSGADWKQVHCSVGGHLWDLVEYAHRNDWSMLSAIVGNKPNVRSGAMERKLSRDLSPRPAISAIKSPMKKPSCVSNKPASLSGQYRAQTEGVPSCWEATILGFRAT